MQILFIEKFKCKCKYFLKIFKMHLNANAFDPISAINYLSEEAPDATLCTRSKCVNFLLVTKYKGQFVS